MNESVGIAILGCGTVGTAVAERLIRDRVLLQARGGVPYELVAIAIRDPHKRRAPAIERRLFTLDAAAVVDDPRVDLVIELIGGETEAAALVERALLRGRFVITANKDLIASRGHQLRKIARQTGSAVYFDAAAGGAVPMLRTLEDALAGDTVTRVAGILNGTATTILSAMEQGRTFAEALESAQSLGYAEADATSDIEGADAAHKLALLAQESFGADLRSPQIPRTGIDHVTPRDISRAAMFGYRIRLVAAAVRDGRRLAAEVAPLLVCEMHDFGRASGAENVLRIEARDAGVLIMRGRGAGGAATASSVLADLVRFLRSVAGVAANRAYAPALAPVAVEPLFHSLRRIAELPGYAVWDDGVVAAAPAYASA